MVIGDYYWSNFPGGQHCSLGYKHEGQHHLIIETPQYYYETQDEKRVLLKVDNRHSSTLKSYLMIPSWPEGL